MRKLNHKLVWNSVEVVNQVLKNTGEAYTEFGLLVEAEAKKELQKGHGVLTGTLRRSIHLAEPGYDWKGDNVSAKEGPERGGKKVTALTAFGKVTLLIGSGLDYALPVHQGHGNFEGYHYLTNALAKVKPELPAIIKKHKMKG